MTRPVRATLDEARAAPIPPGSRSALLMEHGTMKLRYYAPRGADRQTPHGQDELYVVASGRGTFVVGGQRVPFGPGDVLFAAAGVEHRFEAFSEDFATWVVFYGPEGGESG
ncbi:MAG TPA: cupin domain-containing protein [Methylomirabilota bacterium]|jgi:mannose-6-phosphate isomerase-like protein (cupin superfamily)|nr:cupin domain-containing protein [Methylomirabilota bacterium]